MKAPFRWTFPAVAAVATLIAVGTASQPAIAIPAATCAVAAAGVALWDAVRLRGPAPSAPVAAAPPEPTGGSESWLRGGELGQEAVVLLLDRIDRALYHPDLPVRTAHELAGLRGLSREEFLGYVDRRMTELEGTS
ncbi:MAG: hypothetical protein ACLQD8_05285 [Thermoplasmata archaeon]